MMVFRLLTGLKHKLVQTTSARRHQVTTEMVSTALTPIGQMITLAIGINPSKVMGLEKLLPLLAKKLVKE
jgi:hypothetical protein